jgi:hypothetical protein
VATLVGVKAHDYLGAPGFSGKIIMAGSKSVFIETQNETQNGDIFAASWRDQQPHPRSLLTDLDISKLEVGDRLWIESGHLRFFNGQYISLKDAPVWSRPPVNPWDVAPITQVVSRCDKLLRTALARHRGENLGLALPYLADDASAGSNHSKNISSSLALAGITRIRELLPTCRRGDIGAALHNGESLIGLGHGLTPSGDDFLGGMLFTSFHLNAAYPAVYWWDKERVREFLERSASMTSRISHALLADLAEGRSHQSLHDLVDGLLLTGFDFDATRHVDNVTSIGHSSGWDMLTGMLAGMLPVLNRT